MNAFLKEDWMISFDEVVWKVYGYYIPTPYEILKGRQDEAVERAKAELLKWCPSLKEIVTVISFQELKAQHPYLA